MEAKIAYEQGKEVVKQLHLSFRKKMVQHLWTTVTDAVEKSARAIVAQVNRAIGVVKDSKTMEEGGEKKLMRSCCRCR